MNLVFSKVGLFNRSHVFLCVLGEKLKLRYVNVELLCLSASQ